MLSISAMGKSAKGSYYLELGGEDFDVSAEGTKGHWFGSGAKELGLEQAVEPGALRLLLQGYSRFGIPILQNAGHANHQPGWDLTFSAPKSVSVLWALAEPAVKLQIEAAHRRSVHAALDWIQDTNLFSRSGRDGARRETAGMVAAIFEHHTSRASDPQLHSHALLLNAAVRMDGTTGAIESKPIYQAKMASGALYRSELAYQLQSTLGLPIERQGTWFEVTGVPKPLLDTLSQRRQEVEDFLKQHGFTSPRAGEYAALETRGDKNVLPPHELLSAWQEIGERFGLDRYAANSLCHSTSLPTAPPIHIAWESAYQGVNQILWGHSYFAERDIVRRVAEDVMGRGLGAREIRSVIGELLDSPQIVPLRTAAGEQRYTSQEMLQLENSLFDKAMATQSDERHCLSPKSLQRETLWGSGLLSPKQELLSEQQHQGLRQITVEPGSIQVLSGLAGTGKTTILSAAREAWEKEGYSVIGIAPTSQAAKELEQSSGIATESLSYRFWQLVPSFAETWKYHMGQLWRAAWGKPTYPKEELYLHERKIVVLDEASRVGTRQMATLVEEVTRSGAKLVLVGDEHKASALQAGSPFAAMRQWLGGQELTDVKRQRDAWAQSAVRAAGIGPVEEALKPFQERGFLSIQEDRPQARSALIEGWQRDRTKDLKDTLILSGTSHEAVLLNREAQAARRARGELGFRYIRLGGATLYEKDRLQFLRSSRLYGLRDGSLGTLERIEVLSQNLHIRLDEGRRITIPVETYAHIALGYALPVHRTHGRTVERAFALLDDTQQGHDSVYLQVSRAREQTWLYGDSQTLDARLIPKGPPQVRQDEPGMARDLAVEEEGSRPFPDPIRVTHTSWTRLLPPEQNASAHEPDRRRELERRRERDQERDFE